MLNTKQELINNIDIDVKIIITLQSKIIEELSNKKDFKKIIIANEKIERASKRYDYNMKKLKEYLEKGEDK